MTGTRAARINRSYCSGAKDCVRCFAVLHIVK
jgi:hypothetical protein